MSDLELLKECVSHWRSGQLNDFSAMIVVSMIVDPNLFLIAEIDNNPVAYIWSNPDYNQLFRKLNGKLRFYNLLDFLIIKNKIEKGILNLIGIKKDLRNLSIGSLLNYKVF